MDSTKERKMAVVGSRSVGKSALTVQLVEGHFVESYYPTIENTFSKVITYKGKDYATEIVDTAGQDEYSILSSKHFLGIHGYMLVYSVSSRHTFDMLKPLRERILYHLGADQIPLVLVGNKCDLKADSRQVSFEDGVKLAAELNCSFTEASARLNTNVAHAFELMMKEMEKSPTSLEPASTEPSKCSVM